MKQDAFQLAEKIKLHTFEFKICPPLWEQFSIAPEIMDNLVWVESKFLNEDCTDFSDDVKNMPNNSGGIYLFVIKSHIIKNVSEYLAYIGRAQYTDHHNLRVRCRRYLTQYIDEKERPKITTLMNYYRNNLFIRYAKVDNNDMIIKLEADLINTLLPPFNDEIPEKIIREAVNAF